MIVVFSGDRAWRARVEQALRARGVAVRSASRAAELAKCLADGQVRMIVAGSLASDVTQARQTAGTLAVLPAAPGETPESVVHRALGVQPTSSA